MDISKAPGYRGTAVSSPVGSKTSSSSTTPPCMPNIPQNTPQGFGQFPNDLQSRKYYHIFKTCSLICVINILYIYLLTEIKTQLIQPMTGLAVARPTSNNMGLSVTVGPNNISASGATHSSAPPTPLGSMIGIKNI